jgi:hypothetical protein
LAKAEFPIADLGNRMWAGVAAVIAALSKRQSAWARLARELSPELPAETTRVEPMSKVAELANAPSSIGRPIRV